MRFLRSAVVALALCALVDVARADGPGDVSTVVVAPLSADTANVADLLKEVTALRTAVGQAKTTGDRHMLFLEIAAIAALLTRLGISGLKKIPEDELSDKAKHIIPIALTAAGGLTVVLTHYAAGEGWVNSIILGGAAPGAVFAHELWGAFVGLLKKKPPAITPLKSA